MLHGSDDSSCYSSASDGDDGGCCSSASDEEDEEYYSDGQEMMVHLIQLRFMITIIMAQNHLQTVTPFPRHLATIIQPRQ
jgi:hypothetical protein